MIFLTAARSHPHFDGHSQPAHSSALSLANTLLPRPRPPRLSLLSPASPSFVRRNVEMHLLSDSSRGSFDPRDKAYIRLCYTSMKQVVNAVHCSHLSALEWMLDRHSAAEIVTSACGEPVIITADLLESSSLLKRQDVGLDFTTGRKGRRMTLKSLHSQIYPISTIRCAYKTRRSSRQLLAGEVGGSESDVAPWRLPGFGQSVVSCAR